MPFIDAKLLLLTVVVFVLYRDYSRSYELTSKGAGTGAADRASEAAVAGDDDGLDS